jgi:ATP-binding cassette subfamily A (ABC1) protein 3
MGTVKGRVGIELEKEIDQILEKTQLLEEKRRLTRELSGGNRRKLSLAMALIGGS